MSSSFSIGVMKIMSTPISVVSAIQPRIRYSRVGLLIPRVRRRGRACISPTVRVAWIFTENGLRLYVQVIVYLFCPCLKSSSSQKKKKHKCMQDNCLPQKMCEFLFSYFPISLGCKIHYKFYIFFNNMHIHYSVLRG